jgi:hypothetical protein
VLRGLLLALRGVLRGVVLLRGFLAFLLALRGLPVAAIVLRLLRGLLLALLALRGLSVVLLAVVVGQRLRGALHLLRIVGFVEFRGKPNRKLEQGRSGVVAFPAELTAQPREVFLRMLFREFKG